MGSWNWCFEPKEPSYVALNHTLLTNDL